MVEIGDNLFSDHLFERQFLCDLTICKGGCCVEGDAGAPLTDEEVGLVEKYYPMAKSMLSDRSIAEIDRVGSHEIDDEFDKVTPTIDQGLCVYGYKDESGIVKCSFETLYREGKSDFIKPISCHLFPLRMAQVEDKILANFEYRESTCSEACTLGEKNKLPVFRFLREPIVRFFGQEVYDQMEAVYQKFFTPDTDSQV